MSTTDSLPTERLEVVDTAPATTAPGPDGPDPAAAPAAPAATATTAAAAAEGFGQLMGAACRRSVGAGNVLGGVLALVAVVWSYGVAERLVVSQDAATDLAVASIAWWGPSFSVSLATSLILAGAAAGFLGSLVQQSIVFAARAGAGTLEGGYLWWYVLRPVWSALLGAVVVLTVNAGLVSIGDESTSTAGLTVLVTTAAVAGLFTDQALQRLRGVLGASDPAGPGT